MFPRFLLFRSISSLLSPCPRWFLRGHLFLKSCFFFLWVDCVAINKTLGLRVFDGLRERVVIAHTVALARVVLEIFNDGIVPGLLFFKFKLRNFKFKLFLLCFQVSDFCLDIVNLLSERADFLIVLCLRKLLFSCVPCGLVLSRLALRLKSSRKIRLP